MALRLSANHIIDSEDEFQEREQGSSGEDEEEDLTWDDWVSDSADKRPCWSLFEEKVFPSVDEALKNDKEIHGIVLEEFCGRLGS